MGIDGRVAWPRGWREDRRQDCGEGGRASEEATNTDGSLKTLAVAVELVDGLSSASASTTTTLCHQPHLAANTNDTVNQPSRCRRRRRILPRRQHIDVTVNHPGVVDSLNCILDHDDRDSAVNLATSTVRAAARGREGGHEGGG